jgi:hypothetical protein
MPHEMKLIAFPPVLASLAQNRVVCWAVLGVAGVHLTLVGLNLPSWQCPIRHGLGVPCPSCGLSRAITALLQGQWQQALAIHAFAPIVLVILLLLLYLSVAPPPQRASTLQGVKTLEQQGYSTAVISAFGLYWLVRLVLFREALYHFVM